LESIICQNISKFILTPEEFVKEYKVTHILLDSKKFPVEYLKNNINFQTVYVDEDYVIFKYLQN